MHSPNAWFDEGSSESQQGGGLVSHDGPKTPKSHCTWHSITSLVHLSVARITFSANFAPALANCFWQCATVWTSGMVNAAAGAAPASTTAMTWNAARFDMGPPFPLT